MDSHVIVKVAATYVLRLLMAKRTRKFHHKYIQVAKRNFSGDQSRSVKM